MDDRYWPFSVLPPDQRTELHQQQINFLEAAHAAGFRPYVFGVDNYAASAGSRSGMIIYRTRRFVEVCVGEPERESLSAYVRGFVVAAEAVLGWLRGSGLPEVLEFIRPHLEPAGGRASGYELYQPTT